MIIHLRLTFLFLFFFLFKLLAQPDQWPSERMRASNSKVKSVKVFSLRLNKDIDRSTFLDNQMNFDRSGNLTELVYYDSTNLEMAKWTYVYQGSRLQQRIFSIYRDTIAKTKFTYSEKGLSEMEVTENGYGMPLCICRNSYDSKGRVCHCETDIFPEMYAFVRQAYKFDRNGLLILRYLENTKSSGKLKLDYEYGPAGAVGKIKVSRNDSVMSGWITYGYNRKGQLKELGVKSINGKSYKVYYRYDDHASLAEESKQLFLNTVILDQEKNVYTNDGKGNAKKRLRFKMDHIPDMLYNYLYEYYE